MSNVMSRSKSRWKAVLLASVASAVVTPLAAKATMTVSLDLSPLGATGAGTATAPLSLKYLTPDNNGKAVPVYVYATITGTGGPSASDIAALQYLYYSVNASTTGSANVSGGLTLATLNSTIGGGLGFTGNGSQPGQINSGSSIALGATNTSSPVITQYAKPRAAISIMSTLAADGTNVVKTATSTSFLVETLTYTPTAFTASATGAINTTSLSLSVPTQAQIGVDYNPTNYFTDLTAGQASALATNPTNTSASALGANAYPTQTAGYSAVGSVTLTDTLLGDANGDGQVDQSDLGIVLAHYFATDSKWSDGNFLASTESTIGQDDLGIVLAHYFGTIGATPTVIAADAAVLADPSAVAELESHGFVPAAEPAAVPEPASIGMLLVAGAGLIGRRRKN